MITSNISRTQHTTIALFIDFVIVTLSIFTAYALRFDFTIPTSYLNDALLIVVLAIPVKLLSFLGFRLYRGMYRYSSIWDMLMILKATTVASVVLFTVVTIVAVWKVFPGQYSCWIILPPRSWWVVSGSASAFTFRTLFTIPGRVRRTGKNFY